MGEVFNAVLRMPPEAWIKNPVDECARFTIYVEAADRIEQLEKEIQEAKTAL